MAAIAAALSACRHPSPTPVAPVAPTPAVTVDAAVEAAVAPRPPTACEASWAATRRVYAAVAPRTREPGDTDEDRYDFNPNTDEESPFRACAEAPGGTWSIELATLTRPEAVGHRVEGQWALVFTGRDGARIHVRPAMTDGAAEPNFIDSIGERGRGPHALIAYDYDGDGVAEAVTVATGREHEGPSEARAQVWTVRDGAIVPYAPAAAIDADDAADVDGDGRPDLLTHLGYEAPATAPGSGFDYVLVGPLFVAHATPQGGFALDDAVALAEADRRCSPAPASVIVPVEEGQFGVDDQLTAGAIVCARLRGAPAGPMLATIRRACDRSRPGPGGERETACSATEQLLEMARRAPPVHLPPHRPTSSPSRSLGASPACPRASGDGVANVGTAGNG